MQPQVSKPVHMIVPLVWSSMPLVSSIPFQSGEFAWHGGDGLEIVDLHRARRTEGDGLREDEGQLLIFGEEAEREDEEAESEVLHGKGWS